VACEKMRKACHVAGGIEDGRTGRTNPEVFGEDVTGQTGRVNPEAAREVVMGQLGWHPFCRSGSWKEAMTWPLQEPILVYRNKVYYGR